jgi:hypothetical protein
MRVLVTPEAEAQLDSRRRWWRDHREKAPDLFDEEFLAAVKRIGGAARCHLYFEIDEQVAVVWVIAAGGGQRRRPPRFRLQDALLDSA